MQQMPSEEHAKQQPQILPYFVASPQSITLTPQRMNNVALSAMTLAILGLISGLLYIGSVFLSYASARHLAQADQFGNLLNYVGFLPLFQFIVGLIAIILGSVGLRQINHSKFTQTQKGQGIATVAIVIGAIVIALIPIFWIIGVILVLSIV